MFCTHPLYRSGPNSVHWIRLLIYVRLDAQKTRIDLFLSTNRPTCQNTDTSTKFVILSSHSCAHTLSLISGKFGVREETHSGCSCAKFISKEKNILRIRTANQADEVNNLHKFRPDRFNLSPLKGEPGNPQIFFVFFKLGIPSSLWRRH